MFVYVNGEIKSENEATISVFDHGFLYGLGVFETFRIYDGHPFLLDDHFHRLQTSAAHLGIKITYDRNEVKAILQKLCKANDLQDAYVRWNVSAGIGEVGLQVTPYEAPTTIIYMKQIPKLSRTKKAKMLKLRRNSPEGYERLKSHHYLNNILGKKEIGSSPEYEGIFLTEKGYVAEGIVSNIFWVKDRTVFTPAVETGILNGVTRMFVLKLLQKLNIPYEEGLYTIDQLLAADEVFITNSIQEIVALTEIDETNFTNRCRVTDQLQSLYDQYKYKLYSREDVTQKS